MFYVGVNKKIILNVIKTCKKQSAKCKARCEAK